ncbi:hypothetical protein [Paraburkholderia unamae]|uniref:Uncharacterized protein n=1 Tax=Paraburkholderia unamae TaxID=219649 RepID=A0ACC6RHZ7_9BURK
MSTDMIVYCVVTVILAAMGLYTRSVQQDNVTLHLAYKDLHDKLTAFQIESAREYAPKTELVRLEEKIDNLRRDIKTDVREMFEHYLTGKDQ